MASFNEDVVAPMPQVTLVSETPTAPQKKKGQAPLAPKQRSGSPATSKQKDDKTDVTRPCAEHNFLTDVSNPNFESFKSYSETHLIIIIKLLYEF